MPALIGAPVASQSCVSSSDGYLVWRDNTLQIRETANTVLDTHEFYFRVVDSPDELRELILDQNKERNCARMVADYCWPWASKKAPNAWDIVIPEHDVRVRWNLTQDGGVSMVSPNSVSEVGCIHTCQGLEVDYIGVIIGPDLIVRDWQLITQPENRAGSDQSVKGWKEMAKRDPEAARKMTDAIIKTRIGR